jgi:hypothetical protein
MMMSHFDLPVRNRKDLGRAAQLRSLALARPVLPSSPYGNNTYPSPNRRSIRPSRNNMTNNSTTNPYYLPTLLDPYLTSSQTDLHLLNNLTQAKPYYHPTSSPSPYHHHNSSSSLDNNHHSAPSTTSSSSHPRRSPHSLNPHHSSPTRPSFQKAARALSAAVLNAYHQAERLEGDFAAETRYLHYADQRVLALLWRSKVGFCGWRDELGESGNDDGDEDEDAEGFGRTERRDDGRDRRGGVGDENLFAVCAGKLLDAIEDMKDAGRAWLRGKGSGSFSSFSSGVTGGHGEFGDSYGVGVEDVRLAMKKLSVSFGALAELLEGVRLEKSRCPVLVRELRSAQDVLLGIRGVWEVPSRSGGGGGGRRRDNFSNAATAGGGGGKIPVAAFVEEDWENSSYRGE